MGGALAGNPGDSSALHQSQGHVVFKARDIVPSPTGQSYMGFFVFRNNSRRPIHLSGSEGPRAGIYTATQVEFEVQGNEDWTKLDIGYDGIPNEFTVAPNSECLLAIDLFAFKERSVSVVGRVRVGGYTSESFVLDWAADRSKGRFRLAREQNLNKIRKLLRGVGFKRSVIAGEDFCRRLLVTILSPTDSDDLGFAPFRGDLDVVPIESLGGNLRFDFHGSVLVDDEYQYSGMLVLNPATFTPAWYQTAALNYSAVGTWGKGRTLKLDDGSGFYSDGNKLYLEIKYRAPHGQTLPDEDASKRLLSRILDKLGDCLEPSGG